MPNRLLTILLLSITLFVACNSVHNESNLNLSVMSFNIRYRNNHDGENNWENRREKVVSIIAENKLDFVGLQEVLSDQLSFLDSSLTDYLWIGCGREDGREQGEYAPIFYDSAKYTLVEDGVFWLSPNPDSVGSVGWDAALTRIATWGIFEEKITKEKVAFFNTHFDHAGFQARIESAKLIKKQITTISDSLFTILTGDFNFDQTNPAYDAITASSASESLFDLASAEKINLKPQWTFHGFEKVELPNRTKIDFIFTNRPVDVISYRHLTDRYDGKYPSDHLPVLTRFRIK